MKLHMRRVVDGFEQYAKLTMHRIVWCGSHLLCSRTEASAMRPHMMRCMLVSNLALDQRFACVDGISEYPFLIFVKRVCHPL